MHPNLQSLSLSLSLSLSISAFVLVSFPFFGTFIHALIWWHLVQGHKFSLISTAYHKPIPYASFKIYKYFCTFSRPPLIVLWAHFLMRSYVSSWSLRESNWGVGSTGITKLPYDEACVTKNPAQTTCAC